MQRIQRRRIKGWRMPHNTISVTRGTPFGNPFKIGGSYKIGNGKEGAFMWLTINPEFKREGDGFETVLDNYHAVEMYKRYLSVYPLSKDKIAKLRGKNLACFCKIGEPCHADVLLEIANK